MLNSRKLIIVIISAVILSACSLGGLFNQEPSAEAKHPLEVLSYQLKSNGYSYEIYQADASSPSYLVEVDSQGNKKITDYTRSPIEELIYTTNDETFYKTQDQDTWLKLTIGKINTGYQITDQDPISWDESKYSLKVIKSAESANCSNDLCDSYHIYQGTGTASVKINLDDQILTELTLEHDNEKYLLKYRYDQELFNTPQDYQEFDIDSEPSDEIIEKINQIYGTN